MLKHETELGRGPWSSLRSRLRCRRLTSCGYRVVYSQRPKQATPPSAPRGALSVPLPAALRQPSAAHPAAARRAAGRAARRALPLALPARHASSPNASTHHRTKVCSMLHMIIIHDRLMAETPPSKVYSGEIEGPR